MYISEDFNDCHFSEDKNYNRAEYGGPIYDDENIKDTIRAILNREKRSNLEDSKKIKELGKPYYKEIKQLQKELYELRKIQQLDEKSKELRKIKLEKINQARNLFRKIENGDPELFTKEDIEKFNNINPDFWRSHIPQNNENIKDLLNVVKRGQGSTIYSFRIKLERLRRKIKRF